jgi:nucleoid DNA-binding protein
MNPTKHRKVLEQVSIRLEIDPMTAQAVTDFYWKTVQQRLSSGESHTVQVPGLGVFQIKERALDRKIRRVQGLVRKLEDSDTMQAFAIRKEKLDDLRRLEATLEVLQGERARKASIRESRRKDQPDPTDPS